VLGTVVFGCEFSVFGCEFSVVGSRLWVLVLIGLHAANLGAECLERLFSVVGCEFSVVSCRL
jgi:hypothetical protein